MSETTNIYVLIDPITDEIRYLGKTEVDIRRRYAQHKYNWRREKGRLSHVNSWIKHLSENNLLPIIKLIDEVPTSEWIFWEEYWINQLKAWDCNLCNHTNGGEGVNGYKFTEESKQKRLISLSTSELWKERGKRHSEIMKDKHRNGEYDFLHKPHKEETKGKISKGLNKWYDSEGGKAYKERLSFRVKSVDKINNQEIIHDSVRAAGKHFNVDMRTITNKLENKYGNSRRAKLKNYEFHYIDCNKPLK